MDPARSLGSMYFLFSGETRETGSVLLSPDKHSGKLPVKMVPREMIWRLPKIVVA